MSNGWLLILCASTGADSKPLIWSHAGLLLSQNGNGRNVKKSGPGDIRSGPLDSYAKKKLIRRKLRQMAPVCSAPSVVNILASLPIGKIIRVCLKPFKLRFGEIGPEALEALCPDLWKHSINSAS
jgi:hypothetical protein